MTIAFTPDHFTQREQAVSEIASDGLHLVEVELSQAELTPTAHDHPHRVDIYLLEGVFELRDVNAGRTHRLTAGSKAVVPAGTLHSEYCPGVFRAAIGVSDDPEAIIAASKSAEQTA